jgi:hypothetical protein
MSSFRTFTVSGKSFLKAVGVWQPAIDLTQQFLTCGTLAMVKQMMIGLASLLVAFMTDDENEEMEQADTDTMDQDLDKLKKGGNVTCMEEEAKELEMAVIKLRT